MSRPGDRLTHGDRLLIVIIGGAAILLWWRPFGLLSVWLEALFTIAALVLGAALGDLLDSRNDRGSE